MRPNPRVQPTPLAASEIVAILTATLILLANAESEPICAQFCLQITHFSTIGAGVE